MKLDSIVNEVFLYQNMYFLYAIIISTAAAVAIVGKMAKICKLTFFLPIILKKFKIFYWNLNF
jgi:hypothetical protein